MYIAVNYFHLYHLTTNIISNIILGIVTSNEIKKTHCIVNITIQKYVNFEH